MDRWRTVTLAGTAIGAGHCVTCVIWVVSWWRGRITRACACRSVCVLVELTARTCAGRACTRALAGIETVALIGRPAEAIDGFTCSSRRW